MSLVFSEPVTVVDTYKQNGRLYCNCKCSCGRNFTTRERNVKSGHTKTFGKCLYVKKSEWIGKKTNQLKILKINTSEEEFPPSSTSITAEVECECGKITTKRFRHIYLGSTKSCGCCYVAYKHLDEKYINKR